MGANSKSELEQYQEGNKQKGNPVHFHQTQFDLCKQYIFWCRYNVIICYYLNLYIVFSTFYASLQLLYFDERNVLYVSKNTLNVPHEQNKLLLFDLFDTTYHTRSFYRREDNFRYFKNCYLIFEFSRRSTIRWCISHLKIIVGFKSYIFRNRVIAGKKGPNASFLIWTAC